MNSKNGVRHGNLSKEQKYKKILELVRKHGFSQKEACEVYDINEKTFSAWKIKMERGITSSSPTAKKTLSSRTTIKQDNSVKNSEVVDESDIAISDENRHFYPQNGDIRWTDRNGSLLRNCNDTPLRIHTRIGGDLVLEGTKTITRFDRDLRESGLLMHQLIAGLIHDYYETHDRITSATVSRIKYVVFHRKSK